MREVVLCGERIQGGLVLEALGLILLRHLALASLRWEESLSSSSILSTSPRAK